MELLRFVYAGGASKGGYKDARLLRGPKKWNGSYSETTDVTEGQEHA